MSAPLPMPLRPWPRAKAGLCLGGWLAVLLLVRAGLPTTVHDVAMVSPAAARVELPYTFRNGNGPYTFRATVETTDPETYISIRLDDCIEALTIDGRPFHSTPCAANESWWMKRVDLPTGLSPGSHELVIKGKDNGGQGLLDIRQAHGVTARHVAALFLLGAAWLVIIRKRAMPAGAFVAGAAALLLAFLYHLNTDPIMRSHDIDGHMSYVSYILDKVALPGVQHGWETWQPPLYYAVGALFIRVLDVLVADETFRQLQWLSALVYLSVVLVSVLRWESFGFARGSGWLGIALLVVMPAHVFVSGRINNDAVMAVFGVLVVLLGFSYLREARRRTAVLLGGAVMIAVMTKTSALSLSLAAGLMVLLGDQAQRVPLRERLIRLLAVGGPTAVWVLAWFWRNHAQTGEWMYVNAELGGHLHVTNTAWKYLSFDYDAFLGEANFSTSSGKIRESLPTAIAASLLTGEFQYHGINPNLMSFMRAAFVPVLALLFVGLVTLPARMRERPWLAALLVFLCHAAFLISYNWKYPYACNEDARLWTPAYMPAAVLCSFGLEAARERLPAAYRFVTVLLPLVFLVLVADFLRRVIAL